MDDRGRVKGAYIDPDIENGRLPLPLYKHYDNVLRGYYYRPTQIDESAISTLVSDIVGMVNVAEYLGSLKVVALPVDNALIKQGQVLWRSISANATVWASLGLRIRSELILREALIHMIGTWRATREKEGIEPEVRALCERKWRELNQMKIRAERNIMGHYPSHLQRPAEPNVGAGGKVQLYRGSVRTDMYAPQIIAWMSMNLYRHWVGQHICGDSARYATDEGYAFYTAVAAGGDAYLDHAAVEDFARFFPLSTKARRTFDEQLGLMKEGVKQYVEELVRNRAQLDVGSWRIGHLTCVRIGKNEMPWCVASDAMDDEEDAARTMGGIKIARDSPQEIDDESDEDVEIKRVKIETAPTPTDAGKIGTTGRMPWEESEDEEDDNEEKFGKEVKESAGDEMEVEE